MGKIVRMIILTGLLALAAYNAYLFFVPGLPDRDNGPQRDTDGAAVDQKVVTFSIDGKTSKGLKKWHLEGKAAEIVGDKIHLEDLSAQIDGEEFVAVLTSDKGIYDKQAQEVELIGDVRLVSEDQGYLTTERARWSHNTKDIITDSEVFINRSGMQARGLGGYANSEKKTAKLMKDVTVYIEPSTTISCDGPLEVSFVDNKAVFFNNVHVEDKDGELFSETLTVYIDPEKKAISEVIAEKDVKLKKGNSYTVCGKATYTNGTKSIKFLDKPHIVIDPEEMQESGLFDDVLSKDAKDADGQDIANTGS